MQIKQDSKNVHEQHVAFVDMSWSQADGGDRVPQAFFELPQVGRLAHKGGAMHVSHPWKEVTPMPMEVLEQRLASKTCTSG